MSIALDVAGTTGDPLDIAVLLGWIQELLEPPSWHRYARCKGFGTARFFPGQGEPSGVALTVCSHCVVCEECLKAGRDEIGVWGGLTQRQRRLAKRGDGLGIRRKPEHPRRSLFAELKRQRRKLLEASSGSTEMLPSLDRVVRASQSAEEPTASDIESRSGLFSQGVEFLALLRISHAPPSFADSSHSAAPAVSVTSYEPESK